jgi:tRNA (guanine-N7-)-methyltransferase
MVRERTTCREFTDKYILPADSDSLSAALQSFLHQGKPVEVDLGCGRGRFLLARANRYPDTAFIGIERVTLRLQKVDTRATNDGLANIRLIRAEVLPVVHEILPSVCVSTFYLYFPDPWPKRRHHIRRLVSPEFINGIHRTLVPNGIMHISTDHADYFVAIEKTWEKDPRFQKVAPYIPPDEEETDFGMLFRRQGLPTHRCSFQKLA